MKQASFIIDDMPQFDSTQVNFKPKILSEKILKSKIYGLECKEYNVEIEGSNAKIITTKDIAFYDVLRLSPMTLENETFLYGIFEEPSMNLTMSVGVKSFESFIKDRSIFSIDTTRKVNQSNLGSALIKEFEDLDEEEKKNKEEFGEFSSSSKNKDLIQKLVDENAFDKDHYSISSALKSDDDYDIPNVLLLADRSDKGIPFMTRNELKELFIRHNLLTPNIEKLLELDEQSWSKIPDEYKYKAVCIASIKDHFDKKSTRVQILENLEAQKLGNFKNTNKSDSYVEGKTPLVDILNEVNVLTRLGNGIAKNDDEIFDRVKQFYEIAFEASEVELSISRNNENVSIKVLENIHRLNLNSLKNIDYNLTENYQDESKRVFYDTTEIDFHFYKKLLDLVKQIAADNKLDFAYHIYKLDAPFHRNLEYEYQEIRKICPFLDLEMDALYFQKFPTEEYDPFNSIGTSFPYHPDAYQEEISLNNMKIGGVDAGVQYIKTYQKKDFIKYLEVNQKSFGISKEDLLNNKKEINNGLIKGVESLLNFLPNIKITVSKIFSTTPKSQFYPSFTKEKNQFKDAYSSLYRVIGDDFDASDFLYDSDNHKIQFVYKGEKHEINPGSFNMLEFIMSHLKNPKSGKEFYPLFKLSVTENSYYYMTPNQREELKKLVPIDF